MVPFTLWVASHWCHRA